MQLAAWVYDDVSLQKRPSHEGTWRAIRRPSWNWFSQKIVRISWKDKVLLSAPLYRYACSGIWGTTARWRGINELYFSLFFPTDFIIRFNNLESGWILNRVCFLQFDTREEYLFQMILNIFKKKKISLLNLVGDMPREYNSFFFWILYFQFYAIKYHLCHFFHF